MGALVTAGKPWEKTPLTTLPASNFFLAAFLRTTYSGDASTATKAPARRQRTPLGATLFSVRYDNAAPWPAEADNPGLVPLEFEARSNKTYTIIYSATGTGTSWTKLANVNTAPTSACGQSTIPGRPASGSASIAWPVRSSREAGLAGRLRFSEK